MIGMAGPSYLEPVLSPHLLSLGVHKSLLGVAFALPTIGYALAVQTQSILPARLNRSIILITGLCLEGLAFMLLAPASWLPSDFLLICTGLVLLGIGNAWTYLPSLPLMISGILEKNQDVDKQALCDTLSTLMGTSHFIGGAIGPVSGGFLTSEFGFAIGSTYFGIALMVYCLMYALISDKVVRIVTLDILDLADPSKQLELEKSDPSPEQEPFIR
jgi:MFS family permease